MKVAISVPGRFHLFNLAQQLLQRDFLSQLITSYPRSETSKWEIPDCKVTSIILKEILFRGWSGLPPFLKNIYNPQYYIHQLFDILACNSLRSSDILVAGSSASLKTLARAKSFGAVNVLEHGSSHISYQNEILKEEYSTFHVQPSFSQIPHKKIIEKELEEYGYTDYIAIPSGFVKKTFVEQGISESKLICVPYGVDLSHFKQIPKKDSVFRIIFAGTICLRKGVQYLLQAYSQLRLKNAELVLIGTMADEIKNISRRYADVFSVKHIPHFELYKYYSQGSVFVLPSIEEGLARVLFEAMACGLPVIATTNTGAEDIIENGKHGFVVPIRDIDALKEKILYLYEHQDLARQMGAVAKQKVSSGFTWNDYGNKIIAEYKKILQIHHDKNR